MAIDRRQIFKVPEKNPITRCPVDHDPDRAIGADGMAQATVGYEVLDRADPGSFYSRERRGMTHRVRDEPNISREDEEQPYAKNFII